LIKYHKEDDALYIKLNSGKTIESEEFEDGFIVDFDKNDNIVGIEILNVSKIKSNQLIPLDSVEEKSEKYNISFNRESGKALFWKSSCENSMCDIPVISFSIN
jgi:uncharacterized protein YuzE